MKFAKLKKFINDHILGTVITTLVSLATMVGGYLLVTIKTDLDNLQCRISQFGAKNEYRLLQLKLIVTPLDDIKKDSESFKELANIIADYRPSLKKCETGIDDLKQMEKYKLGLESFIGRNWDKALEHFEAISDQSALVEKSIANVYLHKFIALNALKDPKAADAKRQWFAHIATARDLAAREADFSVKERAVNYLGCSGMFVEAPAEDAITCLSKLVDSGQANYAVYYNLAALHARIKKFDLALKHMEQCMKMSGAQNQRRSDIQDDADFKEMLSDKEFGPKLKKLIEQLSL